MRTTTHHHPTRVTIHGAEVYAALWLGALAIAARRGGPFELDVELAARYFTLFQPVARA